MKRSTSKFTLRAIIGFLIYILMLPITLFWAAGTLDWPKAWFYSALLFVTMIGSRLVTLFKHPDLLEERGKYTQRTDIPQWDRFLVSLLAIYGPIIILVVIGLDYRYEWSPGIPQTAQWVAGIIVVFGYGIAVWALLTNQFFSSVVRIQKERGQFVVSAGPYRFVRHPAYAGGFISALALPFFFESLWALIPTLIINIAMLLRTGLEDQYLQDNLEGYTKYTKQTRYRILPGIW